MTPPSDHSGKRVVTTWPRLLTVELVALYLGVGEQTIRNRGAELPGRRRFGRRVVFDRVILDRMLDRCDKNNDIWSWREREHEVD